MTRLVVRWAAAAAGVCLASTLFSSTFAGDAVVAVEDTFGRPDDTNLGVTEIGGFDYFEVGTTSAAAADTAEILSEQLRLYGNAGAGENGPGLAVIDADLADLAIAADMRFTFPNGIANTSSYNVGGFMLRRNGTAGGFGADNEGQIEVVMHVGGGLFVREVSGGSLNNLFFDNPFGLGGSADNNYSQPGQLPTTFNGLPFDANGNGILEDNEPFRVSANLLGDELSIGINGMEVANLTTSDAAPENLRSTPALYKNRWTGGGTRDVTTPIFDNLVITGTSFAPPPPPPIVHDGSNDPVSEAWVLSVGSVPPVNNGPVDDDGVQAWNINDDSTASGSRGAWTRSLSPEQAFSAQTKGWRLSSTVRVVGLDDVPDGGVELSVFADSDQGYLLWLGSDGFGNTLVTEFGGVLSTGLATGRTAEVQGLGYHDIELVFDPVSGTANAYADGTLIIEDVLPMDREGGSLNRILWGSNASAGVGNANYARVAFAIVPEPSWVVSTLAGGFAACLFSFRKCK